MTASGSQKLKENYPRRADELRQLVLESDGAFGDFETAASRVWRLSQLYLVFIDGEDDDYPKDPEIARTIRDLANSRPICPVDEEAWAWMSMNVADMPHYEIALSVRCAVDVIGSLHALTGAADDNINELVAARNRANPKMFGK
jgi:hypothetical protein